MKFLSKINENKRQTLIIMLVIFLLILSPFLFKNFDAIKLFIQKKPSLGIIISLILYAVFGAAFIPTEPLTLFLAALIGPFIAIIVSTIGNTFACLIEYIIGLGVSDLSDFEQKKAKLPWNLGKLPVRSLVFQFIGRAVPGFGAKFVSVMSGFYRISLIHFIWISVVTNLFGAIVLAFSGDALSKWL